MGRRFNKNKMFKDFCTLISVLFHLSTFVIIQLLKAHLKTPDIKFVSSFSWAV